jgi:hypothetical protein
VAEALKVIFGVHFSLTEKNSTSKIEKEKVKVK